MLRKITLGLLFAGMSHAAWAHGGFYLGLGLGPEMANFDQTAWLSRTTLLLATRFNVRDTSQLSGTGLFGSLFGGYQYDCKKLYIAGELNANISSLVYKGSNVESVHHRISRTRYRVENSFGLSVLPGYYITPITILYGRLGYATGDFTISTSDASIRNVNRYLSGVRYGFGIKQMVYYSQVYAVLEYSAINYQSTAMNTLDVIGGVPKRNRVTPQVSQVQFGVVYNFA